VINKSSDIKQNGTYFITDIFSPFGFLIAQELAKLYSINIITANTDQTVINSTSSNVSHILGNNDRLENTNNEKISILEKCGSSISLIDIDSTAADAKNIYRVIKEKCTLIDGIVFTSEISNTHSMRSFTKDDIQNTFKSNLYEALFLYSEFLDKNIFYLFFSSIAPITSILGGIAHKVASEFLDALLFLNIHCNHNIKLSIINIPFLASKLNEKSINFEISYEEFVLLFQKYLNLSYTEEKIIISPIPPLEYYASLLEMPRIKYTYPITSRENLSTSYVAPRNEIEYNLAQIWQNILETDKVGINDNFFELGGQSITLASLLNQVNVNFNINASMENIVDNLTIEKLARYIMNTSSVSLHSGEI